MPCYRCGTRQVDPDRGQSPWKRGVRGDSQVLICPQCQSGRDWTSDLERCSGCRSVRLVRRLGEVECRDCGQVREGGDPAAAADPADPAVAVADPAVAVADPAVGQADGLASTGEGGPGAADRGSAAGLAEEVARALERVLGAHRVSR